MSAYGLDPGQVRHGLVREERRLEGTRREPLQAADQEGRRGEGDGDAREIRTGLQGELRPPQEARRDVNPGCGNLVRRQFRLRTRFFSPLN